MDKPERIIAAGISVQMGLTVILALSSLSGYLSVCGEILIFSALSLTNMILCYTFLRKEIRGMLRKLDDTIQGLLDESPKVNFNAEEESLPGKFQFQITRLYRILIANKEQERKLREDMSALIADLVHQINTPLSNIEMYTDFLLQEDLDDKTRKKFLENVKNQCEKLGWFGEGFDKAARLETDIISLNPKRAEVLPAVLAAIDQAALKAQQKGNVICLDGDTSIEAVYDGKWTAEAIFNLLDNAVKYGREGTEIHVRLSAYQLFIRVDVENEGKIIPKEEQNEVFRRFYRGENAALVQDGVGLGLYLVREIITGQGGYVLLENWKDKGNRFSIFLRNAGQ
ncbi:MAG: HAMP domain-containing sensor histidine kinase [Eubacteriales bacterium]|nr:HAMP domain-containing sensor histidine kinase [Eubacteriales bacterium]